MDGEKEKSNTMGRICVIGGANIDICGSSLEMLKLYDSNPGTISISFGGVGRNIAQILALLQENVQFVTCFSDDWFGSMLREDCEKLGMDTSKCTVTNEYPSSMYIAILENDNDMKLAMSDMRILRALTPQMLDEVLKSLTKDDIILIDSNLDMECIGYIAANAPCTVAADPVSTSKALRLKDVLSSISIFKPNIYEAEELTGIRIEDETSAYQALEWFAQKGVRETVISMADRGVLLGTEDSKLWFTHRPVSLVNATGGGDSLLGGYVSSRLHGKTPPEALEMGISCAILAIEQDAVRKRTLRKEDAEKAAGSLEIRRKELCISE